MTKGKIVTLTTNDNTIIGRGFEIETQWSKDEDSIYQHNSLLASSKVFHTILQSNRILFIISVMF